MEKHFDLAKQIPVIHNTDELAVWLRPTYTLKEYFVDYDTYNTFLTKLMNLLRASFPIKECREYPIKFRFNPKERKYQTLQFRHFMVNLILWLPFVELNDLDVLNSNYILDCEHNIPNIESYINIAVINTMREYHIKSTVINYSISEVLYNLRRISIDFSMIMGLNFSALTFIEMYNDNEEVREIMETTFDENLQPYEIEQQLSALQAREIDIYKNTEGNPIGVILNSGTGIKNKQFAEFTISEGLKPSLEGVTIPEVIQNSTLLKGLDRPSYLYLDATGARKSLVMSKKVMGRAGHFGKITLLLARTLRMSTEVSDCGTKHLVAYDIKTKKHLSKLNGKFYKENIDDEYTKLLDAKNDTHLIGKTIYVRSAATCALGDYVCPKCVGITASTNYDIADGLSAFESEEISKVVNQSILSTNALCSAIAI